MKRLKFILTIAFLMSFLAIFSQNSPEKMILNLEEAQREAFVKKDTTTLYTKLISPNFVVNAPTNKITTLQELKKLIRSGEVDLESFERVTEKVTFTGDIAIAMGHETLKPTSKMPNAGKTVKRRYTNIWMKKGNTWQLVARQATIISIE